MYNPKVNRIIFDLDKYESEEKLFEDVAKVLQILIKNNEICTFVYEDCGIYVLDHNSADMELGDLLPFWMTGEDYDDFKFWKENNTEEEQENEE